LIARAGQRERIVAARCFDFLCTVDAHRDIEAIDTLTSQVSAPKPIEDLVWPLSAIVLRTIVYHELETIARRSARSRGGCTARARRSAARTKRFATRIGWVPKAAQRH
jgi:hypothetical protein